MRRYTPKGSPYTVAPPVRGSTVASLASGLATKPESVTVKNTPSPRAARAKAPEALSGPTMLADPLVGSMVTRTLPSWAVA